MLFDPSIMTYLLPNYSSSLIYYCHLDFILVAFKDQSTIAWIMFVFFCSSSNITTFTFNYDIECSFILIRSLIPLEYQLVQQYIWKYHFQEKFCFFYWWSFIFHDYWLNHIFLISCDSTTNCSFFHLQWVLDCSLATCQNISRKQN